MTEWETPAEAGRKPHRDHGRSKSYTGSRGWIDEVQRIRETVVRYGNFSKLNCHTSEKTSSNETPPILLRETFVSSHCQKRRVPTSRAVWRRGGKSSHNSASLNDSI